jgi:hypothetical protein
MHPRTVRPQCGAAASRSAHLFPFILSASFLPATNTGRSFCTEHSIKLAWVGTPVFVEP